MRACPARHTDLVVNALGTATTGKGRACKRAHFCLFARRKKRNGTHFGMNLEGLLACSLFFSLSKKKKGPTKGLSFFVAFHTAAFAVRFQREIGSAAPNLS